MMTSSSLPAAIDSRSSEARDLQPSTESAPRYADPADFISVDLAGLMSSAPLEFASGSTQRMSIPPLERVERILIQAFDRGIGSWPIDVQFSPPRLLSRTSAWRGASPSLWADVVAAQWTLEIVEEFADLAEQWANETMFASSIETIVLNSAYQQIIGMGRPALPLILQELEREPAYWFWALAAIAREDPTGGVEEFDAARELWLAWGRDRDLLPHP